MITITSRRLEVSLYCPNGWQYGDPEAEDYEGVVRKFWGEEIREFTVFYDGLPVCGRAYQPGVEK